MVISKVYLLPTILLCQNVCFRCYCITVLPCKNSASIIGCCNLPKEAHRKFHRFLTLSHTAVQFEHLQHVATIFSQLHIGAGPAFPTVYLVKPDKKNRNMFNSFSLN